VGAIENPVLVDQHDPTGPLSRSWRWAPAHTTRLLRANRRSGLCLV